MTTFNPDQFLQASYTEATDTHGLLCPEGDWRAQVSKLAVRTNKSKDGNEYTAMDIVWEIIDDEARKHAGAEGDTKLFCRQGGILDLIEASGGTKVLDFGRGKNVMLGRLREAFHQNHSGKPWSPSMMVGQMGIVKVKHRPNPDDPEVPYADVKAVSEL